MSLAYFRARNRLIGHFTSVYTVWAAHIRGDGRRAIDSLPVNTEVVCKGKERHKPDNKPRIITRSMT
ncbi:hypothetical protein C8024_01565 [Sphingopyxis sp. BSNA05]|nr:hypothetical protein [Sphingopyxis sp. BSNA05]